MKIPTALSLDYKTYSIEFSYYNAIILDTLFVLDVVHTVSHIILTIAHSLLMRRLRLREVR